MAENDAQCFEVIFKGLDRPKKNAEATEQCVSGLVFLLQLAEIDKLVATAMQDHEATIRGLTAETFSRNWQTLSAALFDYGFEVPDEETFAIISGQLTPAAQLSHDIQRLNERGYQPIVLKGVGPRVPLRQRINPFLGVSATVKGVTLQGTRLYLQEQPRFSKKRAICVDNLERLRDKELKQQKMKEKKERESAQKALETQKAQEANQHRAEQDQYLTTKFDVDPKAQAEKTKRTELLRELERLESAYTNDERKMAKLKREAAMESPRRVQAQAVSSLAQTHFALAQATEKRGGPLNPVRLREPSSIPFSASQAPKSNTVAKSKQLPKK
jgi:hypothetical protein